MNIAAACIPNAQPAFLFTHCAASTVSFSATAFVAATSVDSGNVYWCSAVATSNRLGSLVPNRSVARTNLQSPKFPAASRLIRVAIFASAWASANCVKKLFQGRSLFRGHREITVGNLVLRSKPSYVGLTFT
jgi:hypothetical protein